MGFKLGRFKFSIELASWEEPYWWTTSRGGSRSIHLIGSYYEWNAKYSGHILGFILGPIIMKFGMLTKESFFVQKREENEVHN